MALMLSLLAAIVIAPPQQGATDRDWPVGLEFDKSIPQRDRQPLQDSFSRTLPLACERATPCVENCSDDSPTIGVELDGSDRNYTLRWVATDPRLDDPLVVQSSCELCSLVELEQQIATDLTRVCSQLDALDAGPGQLIVSSNPHGAWVRVDGQKVGRTPWSGELTAGEHSIELRRTGHLPQRHSVAIVGNVETRKHFSLTSSFARRGRPKWPAWTTMGLGIAMAVAGTALISVHGQPWAGRCTGNDVDAAGNCRFVLTTRPLGITLAILGTGAIASGVGLMIWAQRDPAQSSAGVTLSGRF